MKVTFTPDAAHKTAGGNTTNKAVVALVFQNKVFSSGGQALDKLAKGHITTAIANSRFNGKAKQVLNVVLPNGAAYAQVILVGAGDAKIFTLSLATQLGGAACAALNAAGVKSATFLAEGTGGFSAGEIAAHMAYGARLRAYRFDKYFTKQKSEQKPTLNTISIMSADPAVAKQKYARLSAVADGVYFTRDLASEPPNVLYPDSFATLVRDNLIPLGVKVEILDEKQLQKLGMGSLLGVAQGSRKPARVVVLQWHGKPNDKSAPLAICGKGVTFDTGGISIKPAQGMEDMKWDMAGAGVVAGLFMALAKRRAPVNVVGLLGIVENMPDGNAQRPGDVVISMSGQTIEVLNTDAEGRLVLADVLWYCQERFKPAAIIDLATLTGAVIIALGSEYAGIMGNNDDLLSKVRAAGDAVGEKCWPLPLCEAFDEHINSKIADVQNISNERGAGSSNGGQFLQRFIKKDQPWVHMDIAGVAWTKKAQPICPEGASGFGVRLLNDMIERNYEQALN